MGYERRLITNYIYEIEKLISNYIYVIGSRNKKLEFTTTNQDENSKFSESGNYSQRCPITANDDIIVFVYRLPLCFSGLYLHFYFSRFAELPPTTTVLPPRRWWVVLLLKKKK